ncbi:MAG: O-methyltransferase [Solitalea-like symbiont of Acarus siro]
MNSIISCIINTYITTHTDPQDKLLQEIEKEAKDIGLHYPMASGHLQGNLLQILSTIAKPKKALEIGTFIGYSTICIAKGLADKGSLVSIDNNLNHINFAKKFIQKTNYNIQLICQDAKEFLQNLDFEPDFVFIDANKKSNLLYYKLVIDKLQPSGVIIIDNVLNKGLVTENGSNSINKSFIELNDFIAKDEKVLKIILPVRDGLLLIVKK